MLIRLFLLFTVVPLVELALLLWVAQWTGFPATVALVILTGVFGAWLARRQGLRAWNKVESQLAAGQLPTEALPDGLMILVAGVLLITPGILTDMFGFALLIPGFRRVFGRFLARRLRSSVRIHASGFGSQESAYRWQDQTINGHDEIIDARVVESDSSQRA